MEAFGRLLDIMDALRERCPWNAEQTFESLRPMTEEEVYELADAVLKGDEKDVCKEIGDLLYHMVFYAKIGEEKGSFDIADCIGKICDKMVFRHPHVFRPDGSLVPEGEAPSAKEIADTWELVKAKEKDGNKTVMSGIPDAMPAVLKALSMQEKARGCGFDWENKEDVWPKVEEEYREVLEACEEEDPKHMEEEFGDLLLALVCWGNMQGLNADTALSRANAKFQRRYLHVEDSAREQGRQVADLPLADLLALWQEAKSQE